MKRSELLFLAARLPVDYIAVVVAGLLAYIIRYQPAITELRPVIFDLSFGVYLRIVLTVSLGAVIIFSLSGLYTTTGRQQSLEQVRKIFLATATVALLIIAGMFWQRSLFSSRFILLVGWIFTFIFVLAGRLLLYWIQRQCYRWGIGVRRAVIVGTSAVAEDMERIFMQHPNYGVRVVGRFPRFDSSIKDHVAHLAQDDHIDEIIQTDLQATNDQKQDLVDFSYNVHIDLKYVADLFETHYRNLVITPVEGLPLIEVRKTRLEGWGRIYKRLFDMVVASVCMIILSPLYLLIALLIKLTSPGGPVLFCYERIGIGGRPFQYCKFRSMVPNAHLMRYDPQWQQQQDNMRDGTPLYKFNHDPRVTRFGHWLRRWSLDELPELFLVVRGSMSLVGPRPHEPEEVLNYQQHHRKVLTLRPGITGMAQVSGRSDLDFEQEVRLDTFYVENWSPWLDLQILLKTPMAIIRHRNAE